MSYAKRGAGAAGNAVDRGAGKKLGLGDKGISGWLAKQKSPLLAGSGRALQGLGRKGGADLVTEAGKGFHADSDFERADLLEGGMGLPEQLALLSKMDDLSKVKSVGGMSLAKWLEKNHQKLGDYQQHGLEKKLKDMGIGGHGLLGALEGGEGDLGAKVKDLMKNGDPKMLAKLMKNGAGMGLDPAQAKVLQRVMARSFRDAFSAQDMADFTAKLSKDQVVNFKDAMQTALKGLDPDYVLGEENANYFRKNGAAASRGIGSEDLWGENYKGKRTETDIASADEAKTATTPPPAHTTTTHEAPAAPAHTPPAQDHNEPAHDESAGDKGGSHGGTHTS
jgi:hypothetical protein